MTQHNNRKQKRNDDVVAPGMSADEMLDKDPTTEEIKAGETTKVTKLIYDEYDPSEK